MNGHTDITRTTGAYLADTLGIRPDTMRKRVHRNFGLSMSDFLSADQVAALSAVRGKSVRTRTAKKNQEAKPIHSPKPPTEPESGNWAASSGQKWRMAGLYSLLIASTVASVYNILRVSMEIADLLSAIVLTVVLSIAAVVFVATGIKTRFTRILVGLLIAFEGVCNLVRIYGGLTQWEKSIPTEFLGTVCQVFNSGTYETARFMGAVTALLIAGVQYGAIFEINKLK